MNDDQFTKLTKQIEDLSDTLSDQILKLYQHTESRFGELEASLQSKANTQDLTRIYDALDGIAKRLDEESTERAAIITQLDRHERWHHQTADKVGLQLDY